MPPLLLLSNMLCAMRGVVPLRWVYGSLFVVKLCFVISNMYKRCVMVIWCKHFMSFETFHCMFFEALWCLN